MYIQCNYSCTFTLTMASQNLKCPLSNYLKTVGIMDKISWTRNVNFLYPSQILLEIIFMNTQSVMLYRSAYNYSCTLAVPLS